VQEYPERELSHGFFFGSFAPRAASLSIIS